MTLKKIIQIPLISLLVFLFACNQTKFPEGKRLYERHCANCHGESGEGLSALYPPVSGSDFWQNNQEKIPCIIRNGIEEPLIVNGQEYKLPMIGIKELSEYEITNIINFVNSSWYEEEVIISPKQVKDLLKNCK